MATFSEIVSGNRNQGNLIDSYNNDIHNHTANISHKHELQYGIKETTLPTDIIIKINDIVIAENINQDIEVEITKYLKLKQLNKIKIYSKTNGRIDALVYVNKFMGF